MGPEGQIHAVKPAAHSNLYTVILALAFFVVVVTAAFVTYKCYLDYHTFFKIP